MTSATDPINGLGCCGSSDLGCLGVTFEVEQAFHGDLVEGIYAAAEPAGYDVVLSPIAPGRPEARAIDDILGDRCEAAILLGPRSSTRSLAAPAAKLPVVVVARSVRSIAVDCVRTDDAAAMDAAVGHLAVLGHRRIAYLDGGSSPRCPGTVAGHENGGRRARLGRRRRRYSRVVGPGNGKHCPHRVQRPLRTRRYRYPRPRRNLCAAGHVGHRVRQQPDRQDLLHQSTTVGQSPSHLTQLAVQRAIARLEETSTDPRDQVVAAELIVRSTTGPPSW